MAQTLALFAFAVVLVISTVLAWMPDTDARITFSEVPTAKFLGNASAKDIFRLLDKDDNSMLIGGRNVIYNLSLDNLKEYTPARIKWQSIITHRELCILKGKNPENDCQNYIRVAVKGYDGKVLVCGTNSYKPYCRHYHPRASDGRFDKYEEIDCTGICSHDPEHNSTAVYTDRQLYSATTADFTGSDSLIYRGHQRTEHSDLSQLNNPSFVSSFRYEDFVFFFFRETAVEFMNCGKAVYSRVARVCVNDKGGPRHLNDKFTSYLKARLNCSFQGDYPFYFDEIQSTSEIISGSYGQDNTASDIIYGVLTTPINSIGGSAVCAFAMRDILAVFNGGFKAQESINSNWLPVEEEKIPKKNLGKCVDDSRNLTDETINFIKTHSLMERAVPSFLSKPLLVKVSLYYRFTAIAIHPQVLAMNGKRYDIIYVGTDNGMVIKTFNAASNLGDFKNSFEEDSRSPVQTIVISEVQLLPFGTPIKQLYVAANLKPNETLIAISDELIVSTPLNQCVNITSCSRCVSIQDPHCAWDTVTQNCIWVGDRKYPNPTKYWQNIETGKFDICNNVPPYQYDDDHTTKIRGKLDGTAQLPAEDLDKRNEENIHITVEENSVSVVDLKQKHETGPYKVNRADNMIYTAQALHIAVVASCLVTLLLGFVFGYLFSRRFKHPFFSETTPFHEQHNHLNSQPSYSAACYIPACAIVPPERRYLQNAKFSRLTPLETPLNVNSTAYLPPRANKTINMVVNVPVKQDNLQLELGGKDRTHECKNSNESLDKDIKCGTLQKVKKTYI